MDAVLIDLAVDAVHKCGLRLGLLSCVLFAHVITLRVIGGDDRALMLKRGALKELKVTTGVVDARGDEHRGASRSAQSRLEDEVLADVIDDIRHALLGAEHLLHLAPVLEELRALPSAEGLGLLSEVVIDLLVLLGGVALRLAPRR